MPSDAPLVEQTELFWTHRRQQDLWNALTWSRDTFPPGSTLHVRLPASFKITDTVNLVATAEDIQRAARRRGLPG